MKKMFVSHFSSQLVGNIVERFLAGVSEGG